MQLFDLNAPTSHIGNGHALDEPEGCQMIDGRIAFVRTERAPPHRDPFLVNDHIEDVFIVEKPRINPTPATIKYADEFSIAQTIPQPNFVLNKIIPSPKLHESLFRNELNEDFAIGGGRQA